MGPGLMPDGFVEKRSRFMLGPTGEPLHKWKVEYATRGGGGRAQCRQGVNCLQRDEKGLALIEKGALRIGRRVVMRDSHGADGFETVTMFWHHAQCLFTGFQRARGDTRVITYEEDMEGFQDLLLEDKDFLRREMRLVGGDGVPQARRFDGPGRSATTPVRRESVLAPDSVRKEPRLNEVKRSIDGTPLLAEGDRVWAHFKEGTARIKSKKPELGVIRKIEASHVLVQFEGAEDEKDRVAKYARRAGRPGRVYYRYPHNFDGPKQHVKKNWLDLRKPVPLKCGCVKQQEAHGTAAGCSCTARGGRNRVCGLDVA